MTPDNHRAPSRLAPIRPGSGYPKPSPLDSTTTGTRPSPSSEYDLDSYEIVESMIEDEQPSPSEVIYETQPRTRSNGNHATQPASETRPTTYPEEEVTPRGAVLPSDALEMQPQSAPILPPGFLSKKERYQMLMQTVQYYEGQWKLASIRMLRGDRMAAYLTPRKRRLDLKTAINRQQVMVISLDQNGNADIKEPPRRSVIQRFIDWLRGG